MNILTFDIEDWFHILDNKETRSQEQWSQFESRLEAGVDRILGYLVENKIKATFFVLGWVAERHPLVIKKIHDLGFEIGSHSYAHQLAFEQTKEAFKDDLYRSLNIIGDIIGDVPKSYRAPGFSLCENNLWLLEELVKAGIEYDCSIFPAKRAHGGLSLYKHSVPGTVQTAFGTIKCFPINVNSVFGREMVLTGGGYFRLFPYWMISNAVKKSDYAMTYFHPRDFDFEQPMIPGLSRIRKFKSYVGLKGAFQKLKRLTQEFPFTDLQSAAEAIDWEDAPQYTLDRNILILRK